MIVNFRYITRTCIKANKYCNLAKYGFLIFLLCYFMVSCSNRKSDKIGESFTDKLVSRIESGPADIYQPVNALLVLPASPVPGEGFRILSTGGSNIRNAEIVIRSQSGALKSQNFKTGNELPFWRIDSFEGSEEGKYKAELIIDRKEFASLEFEIAPKKEIRSGGKVWKTNRSWDIQMETLYSAWINALFKGCNEQSSWEALHIVTQNKEQNFLYNHLSLDEDVPESKTRVIMEPDCADNPFFLRAYFAWKLGLPFGYHICDRGYLGSNPKTGRWVTNETSSSKNNPVLAFNSFARNIMDGVHSGTARTSLDNVNSDYYPVSLDRVGLRPGAVFADPYGHTLTIVSWVPQNDGRPGLLLAVDAQPDNTIAIKRFWKGNFLFTTSEVIGEPGFKAFRPIIIENNRFTLMPFENLTASAGFAPFSLQQKTMGRDAFYRLMERVINPEPLDSEAALLNLIQALHEQLLVRVNSVAVGEAWFKSHPGAVISMPSKAKGIFQTLGPWEDYATPNRDLRLLIAMDEVAGFPGRVASFPEDFRISKSKPAEEIRKNLQSVLEKKVDELSITYTRSDGSLQLLTVAEIIARREAFEMAYNPNDGVEIRWGAPENSEERATCKRQAPPGQRKTMQSFREWFIKRLHPPT